MADKLEASLNPAGSVVILTAGLLISLLLATTFSFAWAVTFLKPRFQFVSSMAERWAEWQADRARQRELRRAQKREKSPKRQTIITEKSKPAEAVVAAEAKPFARRAAASVEAGRGEVSMVASKPKAARPSTSPAFPPTSLLHPPAGSVHIDEAALRERARLIEKKALEFEVEGTVRVASIYSIGLSEMAQLEREFSRRQPDARLEIHVSAARASTQRAGDANQIIRLGSRARDRRDAIAFSEHRNGHGKFSIP